MFAGRSRNIVRSWNVDRNEIVRSHGGRVVVVLLDFVVGKWRNEFGAILWPVKGKLWYFHKNGVMCCSGFTIFFCDNCNEIDDYQPTYNQSNCPTDQYNFSSASSLPSLDTDQDRGQTLSVSLSHVLFQDRFSDALHHAAAVSAVTRLPLNTAPRGRRFPFFSISRDMVNHSGRFMAPSKPKLNGDSEIARSASHERSLSRNSSG